ncbi:YdeI/OmpD-associated family protein [Luteolibacter yonseiensis]|uniref:YdeI/OmpD-associated family protein n=1 Tax=Luteolibacter yonseiensis TaxID=1144680 RepID=A0A934V926_9BACT|nr:YdeI/OmpD-associated family protein [Luteolibacter yonseiensis]MBK1817867.1 YdeI/OmpD-associated family protein [Luteolibacter yonseiensis]
MKSPTFFSKAGDFRQWLKDNSGEATELLVGFHKVDSGRPSMSWSESVDEALCFGWIDGVRRRIDDTRYSIRFTPRKPGSIWSAVNIDKVGKLRSEGLMTPAGEEAFSKRTEARSRVYSHEREAPAELDPAELSAFKKSTVAWEFFEKTPPGYKKVVLHWVTSAKKPETRAARFGKLLEACAAGLRLR